MGYVLSIVPERGGFLTTSANTHRGQADLHIHSAVGDGLASVQDILAFVETRTDLDLISITDHDDVRGTLEARERVADGTFRFSFVSGIEISTRQGHLLAYGINRRYRMFRSLADSIAEVHDDGGFVVVPHPLSWLTLSAHARTLSALLNTNDARLRPDGIETFNPSIAGRVSHVKAISLNRRLWQICPTGGSDAHHLGLIGTARTSFPGRNEADFRQALILNTTAVTGRFWAISEHLEGFWEQQLRSMILAPSYKLTRALSRDKSHAGSAAR